MRIIVKGNSSTDELADVLDCLVARLAAGGIDEVAGVNIYLTPIIAGSKAVFVPEHGNSEEILELIGGIPRRSTLENGMDRVITAGKFVINREHLQEISMLYAWNFCRKMQVSPLFYKTFLDMTPSRAEQALCSATPTELNQDERSRLDDLIDFAGVITKLFPQSTDWISWFHGPYPDSRFEGSTPLEQIEIGGRQVALEIAKTLTTGFRRRLRGRDLPWPPPAHFDRIFRRAVIGQP